MMKDLEFKQFAHRQVIDSVRAWSKRNYVSAKFQTYFLGYDWIQHVIIKNGNLAQIHRFDLWANDQDGSIYEFFRTEEGGIDLRPALPAVYMFKSKDQEDTIIVHLISLGMGFISGKGLDKIKEFLASLPIDDEKTESQTQDLKT
jgi:hypothetical protein